MDCIKFIVYNVLLSALSFLCEAKGKPSLGLVGDSADVTRSTSGGTVLVGGGTDVDAAMLWMINKSGCGDFVVIRASGTDAYNKYIHDLGCANSVETLLINSRTLANDPEVDTKIRGAEALFIAGGDQADYVNYWKGTKVQDALNYLRNVKQVPIGGTSAGCAILGQSYFSALNGSVTSSQALTNPYHTYVTLGYNDFLSLPYLSNVITDSHFSSRDRTGRLVTFLARMNKEYGVVGRGIGVDESTAVCIENDGKSKVFGSGTAFFLSQNGSPNTPETCVIGSPLHWYRNGQAVTVYKIVGSQLGSGSFDLTTWSPVSGGVSQYYYVNHGTLGIS
ncbi:unnamed protein product [Rotaria sordida]|uniref:Cyanophycinase n=1 Tax=Rotaria sordida TaxID=392033 RepID=A0A815L2H5_9BILA|nr:unnamed protein product [Rotaria sordida]CAF1404289.1 unnamed protein product [Rotaria sordida]CAF1522311.1 unnamed protein product [Rotaria sordida]CAF3769914.1 unnamed protein product [Rotaria sordida]